MFACSNFLHSIVASGHVSLVSLLLKFGIFGITGKFEFNSDWQYPSPGDAGEEYCLGQEAADKVVEDLKFELALLNAALKKLDADTVNLPLL